MVKDTLFAILKPTLKGNETQITLLPTYCLPYVLHTAGRNHCCVALYNGSQ